ncbi:hypothetical protein Droror1_Dr00000522 [Drosera rotundifolia]
MMISLLSSELSAMIALSHQKPESLHLVSFGRDSTPPHPPPLSACWVFYASLWLKTLCWLQKNKVGDVPNIACFIFLQLCISSSLPSLLDCANAYLVDALIQKVATIHRYSSLAANSQLLNREPLHKYR